MRHLRFLGIVSLVALLAASLHAEPHKKSRAKGKSSKESSSSGLSMAQPPPSSLMETPPPAAPAPAPTPPSSTNVKVGTAPAESAPAAADTPPETDADHPRINLMPLVLVGVEPLWEGRVFRQSEGGRPDVHRYGAIGYPSVEVNGELYPLANSPSKFLRGFGITLQFARAFGFESDTSRLAGFATQNVPPAETSFMRYAAGVRYRIHTNPESETPFVFGISAALRRWQFAFNPQLPLGDDLEVPSANYRMARIGVDGALEVKRVTFYGGAYYLHTFAVDAPNTRELSPITPYAANSPGVGGEFRGAIGVRLAHWVELRLSVEYAIAAYQLRGIRDGDTPDTVLDSYLSAGLGPYLNF